ncbi:hypothetical protein DID88_004297 [Monilinia fructigena]|uniref:Uncharacterized protein n=1 Tax=Monilinia fructigena TaxID=38457 RepID=A0A395IY10_9HELO|nr:hypothetical protein DID88_004297 [Monilinia fructigena]
MIRPQACGEGVNNIFIFAAILFVLPWLLDAQQQQRSALTQYESPPEAISSEAIRTPLEATKIKTIETPLNILRRRKNTLSLNRGSHDKIDASADSAPLAPSHLAKSSILESNDLQSTGWGSSQPSARDIQDWEVEDFVLLATVMEVCGHAIEIQVTEMANAITRNFDDLHQTSQKKQICRF